MPDKGVVYREYYEKAMKVKLMAITLGMVTGLVFQLIFFTSVIVYHKKHYNEHYADETISFARWNLNAF